MENAQEGRTIINSYEQLKSHIIEHVRRRQIRTDVITDLKNSFGEQINSRRRISCIDSIEDLINVLEKRNIVNPFKVDILEKIVRTVGADKSKYLSHCELLSDESTRASVNNINIEEDDNQEHRTQGQCSQPERHSDVSMGCTQVNNCRLPRDGQRQQCNHQQYFGHSYGNRIQPEVIGVICSDIGNKWKDLARSLEIKEGIIDEIDTTYQTLSTKCRMMLEHYEKTVKQCEIKSKLLKGLQKACSKDLADKVQNILV